MIILKDSIYINCSIDELYLWFANIDNNFIKWSPYHTDFKKLTGGFEIGDKIQFEEIVDGVSYNIKGKIIEHYKTDNEFSMIFETKFGLAHIYFIGKTLDNGVEFTHIEKFGKSESFFGKFINKILFDFLFKNKADWNLILNDMKEDNLYLKNYLEKGEYGY